MLCCANTGLGDIMWDVQFGGVFEPHLSRCGVVGCSVSCLGVLCGLGWVGGVVVDLEGVLLFGSPGGGGDVIYVYGG